MSLSTKQSLEKPTKAQNYALITAPWDFESNDNIHKHDLSALASRRDAPSRGTWRMRMWASARERSSMFMSHKLQLTVNLFRFGKHKLVNRTEMVRWILVSLAHSTLQNQLINSNYSTPLHFNSCEEFRQLSARNRWITTITISTIWPQNTS